MKLICLFQSLDYDTCENHLLLDEERKKGYPFIVKKSLARWLIFLMIGMITALIACVIDISIEEMSQIKYARLSKCTTIQPPILPFSINFVLDVDTHVTEGKLYIPYFYWVLYNIFPVLIGSLLVTYVEVSGYCKLHITTY